jgi:hypothetical protein
LRAPADADGRGHDLRCGDCAQQIRAAENDEGTPEHSEPALHLLDAHFRNGGERVTGRLRRRASLERLEARAQLRDLCRERRE